LLSRKRQRESPTVDNDDRSDDESDNEYDDDTASTEEDTAEARWPPA
jgi:hypothetical protein